jgi:phage tail tape-measure protein
MKCYHGDGNEEELNKLVQTGELTQHDADAIRGLRNFLREQARKENNDPLRG